MIDRINLLLRAKNITAKQFAEEIGIQPSGMSHILGGRNNPSLDFVTKVLRRYPELDANWLLLGRGEMYGTNEGATRPATDAAPTLFSPVVATPQPEPPRVPEPPIAQPASPQPLAAEPEPPIQTPSVQEPTPRYAPSYIAVPPETITPPEEKESTNPPTRELVQLIMVYSDHTFSVMQPRKE